MSFRSLLQGFQAATGTPVIDTGNSNNMVPSEDRMKPKDTKSAIFEWTSQVWNQTLIRRATSRRRFQDDNQSNSSITDTASASTLPKPAIIPMTETPKTKIHLAVCICIVDALPHENIWKRWIRDSTATVTASVYLHAKHPETIRERGSTWLQDCLIPISHRPDWNDVRIIRAMLSLIDCALNQPSQSHDASNHSSENPVSHILFATESCIPVAPIQALEQVLQKEQILGQPQRQSSTLCSFLNYYGKDDATRFEERHCWNIVSQYLPMDCIQKVLPGWCLLTAQHAREVLQLSYPHRPQSPPLADLTLPPLPLAEIDLTTAFEECWAPEEVYFATALCLLGHIQPMSDDDGDDGPIPTVRRESVVYAEWPPGRRETERAHPKTWDEEFSSRLVNRLRQRRSSDSKDSCQPPSSHILFLRKVKHQMPTERWEEAVLGTVPPHSAARSTSPRSPAQAATLSNSFSHHSPHPSRFHSDHRRNENSYHQQRTRSLSPSSHRNKRRRSSQEVYYKNHGRDGGRHTSQRQRHHDDNR